MVKQNAQAKLSKILVLCNFKVYVFLFLSKGNDQGCLLILRRHMTKSKQTHAIACVYDLCVRVPASTNRFI